MLIGEPPASQGDLHFRLFGVPVRVHPWFWVITVMMGVGAFGGGNEKASPINVLIWVGVVFVSILVHEFGHAFTQRYFGGRPWVTLYGFGGLASCDDCDRSPRSQILISLAGPAAGFLLAASVVLFLYASGRFIGWERSLVPVVWKPFDVAVWAETGRPAPRDRLILDLLWVNIGWGLINLLPIYPLDGGRISRELFTMHGNPRSGIVSSLWLSVITAGAMVLYGVSRNSIFIALMFGFLAYGSYQSLRAYQNYSS